MSDQRRYPRIATHHAMLVRQMTGDAVEAFAHTTTLAVGGSSFVSDESFAKGATLELLISIDHRVVNAPARVVYDRLMPDGRHEIGVEFGRISDEDAEAIQRILENPATVD